MRSEEGEGFRKEGDGGDGEKKKEKRTCKKCSEKKTFSCRKMHLPAEKLKSAFLQAKCLFLQKSAVSCRKLRRLVGKLYRA